MNDDVMNDHVIQTPITIAMQHPGAKRSEFLGMFRELEGKPPRIPQVRLQSLDVVASDECVCVCVCGYRHFRSENRAGM